MAQLLHTIHTGKHSEIVSEIESSVIHCLVTEIALPPLNTPNKISLVIIVNFPQTNA